MVNTACCFKMLEHKENFRTKLWISIVRIKKKTAWNNY